VWKGRKGNRKWERLHGVKASEGGWRLDGLTRRWGTAHGDASA
jgi:hypothetical protein